MGLKTLHVETVAQAYLELLRERGVECFFGNAGTDFASLVDAFARFSAEGKTTPRPLVVPHEFVAAAMAHGYYLATGRPQVVMVHVTVGTANAIGAIINASRSNVPILFSAGRTPVTEEGLPGARNLHIHWAQEAFDQGGMLREYVKWDYELRNSTQLQSVVDRAFELMLTEPRGPAYLTLPREVLAARLDSITIESPPRRRTDARRFPDPERIEEAARLLARAKFPLVLTSMAGRDPAAVRQMVELAEAGAIGVVEVNPYFVNFPQSHPFHLGFTAATATSSYIEQADAILVVESDVPWYPAVRKPREDAALIHLGIDPFFSRYPMRNYPCDVPIVAEPAAALGLLAEAVRRHADRSTVAARRERLTAEHWRLRVAWQAAAMGEAARKTIGFQWVSRCLGQLLDDSTVVVNEYPLDRRHASFSRPASYFASPPSSGLGWGFGAALGIKAADPSRTVIAALGDGAYLFSAPTSCHFVARAHNLPVLTVIFNNQKWEAVKAANVYLHPQGWAKSTEHFPLSDLTPSPRFEEIVKAFDGYGERVEDPREVTPALQRGLAAVREGRQALLNILCQRAP
ncbi:MAG: thiamine pyrophosphate-requiring protein [Candidatus Rokubacteria bacterium]|nr:thiamine pyrophosphate-requiring protein [Candidatus Rokubacteria bacterium]